MIPCRCGRKMLCKQTRSDGRRVLRRYHCICGLRVTTAEFVATFDEEGDITLHNIGEWPPRCGQGEARE